MKPLFILAGALTGMLTIALAVVCVIANIKWCYTHVAIGFVTGVYL